MIEPKNFEKKFEVLYKEIVLSQLITIIFSSVIASIIISNTDKIMSLIIIVFISIIFIFNKKIINFAYKQMLNKMEDE